MWGEAPPLPGLAEDERLYEREEITLQTCSLLK